MEKLCVVGGVMERYSVARGRANFFFQEGDRAMMGTVAIATGAVGAIGPAVATASAATDLEEEADQVSFELDGKKVRGWLWRSPFKEGDAVQAVGRWAGDEFEVVAVVRPDDEMIALYPHLSRGTTAHVRNAAKWYFRGCGILFAVCFLMFIGAYAATYGLSELPFEAILMMLGSMFLVAVFLLVPAVHTTLRWMKFVRSAEAVFAVLGFKDVRNVDLPRSSKLKRTPQDPIGYGVYYFRY